MQTKVNIIGAGISGLSAGCYLQMNGYDTEIFELHSLPGGLCTTWEKEGFKIDGCLHWLVGSSPADPFYELWNELVDMKNLKFFDHYEYFRVEDEKGQCIRAFTNVDLLEKELLEKASEDRGLVMAFVTGIRKLKNFPMKIDKAPELISFVDRIKMYAAYLPYVSELNKWTRFSIGEYGSKCKNPLLKKFFDFGFMPEMGLVFLLFTFNWMNRKAAGYPIGGSLNFANLIEKRYRDLGGKINYHSKVTRILTVDNGSSTKATAIQTENGEAHTCDITISAADGHYTIFNMLEGKFVDKKLNREYLVLKTFPSYLQISIGVNRTFEGEPGLVYFPLPEPLVVDPETEEKYGNYRILNHDPTLAPEGHTLITSIISTYNFQFWVDLKKRDLSLYRSEKDRIAETVIDNLEHRYPGIRAQVKMIDVSTPATVIRYTNNWKGSFEGWILTKEMGFKSLSKELPGLSQFYMIGQWVEPGGGLPGALLSGRNVAQIICKKDGKKFSTTSFR